MIGTLYVIGTPIGNLEDVSSRALRIFREADYVLCEDTRTTRKLLDHYEIKTATLSYHQHSGEGKVGQLLRYLASGLNLALVSDAGTPGISDPGAALVAAVRAEFGTAAQVVGVPGPSAVITALSISGWPVDRFSFFGFLPNKKGRQTMLREVLAVNHPAVVYESKYRIAKLLAELAEAYPDGLELMIARELTKMFESCYFGTPQELRQRLLSDPGMAKGEFVVLIRKRPVKKK